MTVQTNNVAVEITYKEEVLTSEINLTEKYPNVTEHTIEFIEGAVAEEITELVFASFDANCEMDLEANKVLFELKLSADNKFFDSEEKSIKEFIDVEKYAGLSVEDKLDTFYTLIERPYIEWVQSKLEINYIFI